jgi:hypothetical protein
MTSRCFYRRPIPTVLVAEYQGVPASAETALLGPDRLMYDVKRAGKCSHKVEVFS